MKILLVCFAGMSTSMMASRIVQEGENRGLEVEVEAFPMTELEQNLDGVDVVLLGPQVRFAESEARKVIDGRVPMGIIAPQDFGMMRADNVLNQALELLG